LGEKCSRVDFHEGVEDVLVKPELLTEGVFFTCWIIFEVFMEINNWFMCRIFWKNKKSIEENLGKVCGSNELWSRCHRKVHSNIISKDRRIESISSFARYHLVNFINFTSEQFLKSWNDGFINSHIDKFSVPFNKVIEESALHVNSDILDGDLSSLIHVPVYMITFLLSGNFEVDGHVSDIDGSAMEWDDIKGLEFSINKSYEVDSSNSDMEIVGSCVIVQDLLGEAIC